MVDKNYKISENKSDGVGEGSSMTVKNVATEEEKRQEKRLFDYLEEVLDVCCKKFKKHTKKDKSRLAWGRLFVAALKTYGQIRHNIEMEKLGRGDYDFPKEVTINLDYGIPPKDPKKCLKSKQRDKS